MGFIKNNKILVLVVIIIVVIFGTNFLTNKGPEIDFVVVKLGDVVEEVSVTGKVKPTESVDLAFEQSGRITRINVDIGDRVFVGQNLASVTSGNVLASLRQAQANVISKEANLAELKAGTRIEEIAVGDVKVANAEISFSDAKNNIIDKIKDAYSRSDDAIRNRIDQFMSNATGVNPQLEFNAENKSTIEGKRALLEDTLREWKDSINLLTPESNLVIFMTNAEDNLSEVADFISEVSLAVNSLKSSATLSQATVDGWRSDTSIARANVNTGVINLSTAKEKLNTAQSNLTLAKQELILKKAGSTIEQIQAAEAKVLEAKANVDKFNADFAKTIIRSPINGIVVSLDFEVGEIVSVSDIIVSIISAGDLEIESFIPEADIARVSLGDISTVTLDAYGSGVNFPATVVSIDPAETTIEGVSTYKTILQFIEKDKRIKSGMTANIDILTDKKENVLFVPRKAIFTNDEGNDIVRIKDDSSKFYHEVEIITGLIGSDSNAEILSGISDGDEVITYIEE